MAEEIWHRLESLTGAKVRLESISPGDTVEDVWDQGMESSATLLLLSRSSVPAAATREKWPGILKHRESNALPPLGIMQISACKFPQVLERKQFFRYADNPQRALRDLTHWVSNLTERTGPLSSLARLPWFQGRGAELDQLWESLVDDAGVTFLVNPAPGSGKTALAQEFVRAAASHFRNVLWIECGQRTELSIAGELASRLGVALGKHNEDAFARIGALLHHQRMLLVLDDVAEDLAIACAGGERTSVLVTTRFAEAALVPGATVIQLETVPATTPHPDALNPEARELWKAIQACRPQGFPLELATRIAKLDANESRDGMRNLVEERWIDPIDVDGLRYRMGAGVCEPVTEVAHRQHAEALAETFSKWGSQPHLCRPLLAEMEAGLQWALCSSSNWKLATALGHRAAGFLNSEGRVAEAIELYRQLLRTARQRNDAQEVEECLRELSWVDDQECRPRLSSTKAQQTVFDFNA